MPRTLRNIFNITALGFIVFALITSVIFGMGASGKANGLEMANLLLSPILATGLVIAGLYQLARSLSPPKDSKKTTRAIGLMLASIPLMGMGLWQFNTVSASASRVIELVEQGRLEHAQNTAISLLFTHGVWSKHRTIDEYFGEDANVAVYERIFRREPALKPALAALAKASMSRCGPKGPDQHCAMSAAIMAKMASPNDPQTLTQAIKLLSDCHAACPNTPKLCLSSKRAKLLDDFKLDAKGRTLACQAAALTTMHKVDAQDPSYHLLRLDYSRGYAQEALETLAARIKGAKTLSQHAKALAEPTASLTKNYSGTILTGTPEHDAIAHGLRVAQRAILELPPLMGRSEDYIKFTLEARKMASLEIHKHLWVLFNQDDEPFMALRFQGDEAQGALLLPSLTGKAQTPLDEWVGWMTKQSLELTPEQDLSAQAEVMVGELPLNIWRDEQGQLARAVLGKVPLELEHLVWSWAANHAAIEEHFNEQLEQQLATSQLAKKERESYKRRNRAHFQTNYYSDTHRPTGVFIAPLILPSRGYAYPSSSSRSASRSSYGSTSSRSSSSSTSRYSSSPSQRRSTSTSSSRSSSYSSRSRSGYRSGSYRSGK